MRPDQWIGCLAVGGLSLLTAACDDLPNVELYNGTGRRVVLGVAKGADEPHRVELKPGGSVRIWNIYGSDLQLALDGCKYRYELPYMDLNHPWRVSDGRGGSTPDYDHRYPVEIQLQADASLHLMPYSKRGILPYHKRAIVSSTELARSQGHGYPLKPHPGACR